MKVNSEFNKNISFNGFWNSKCIKKGLEFASDYGAVSAATTTLVFSSVLRPLVISATPNTKQENKKAVSAKSVASGILEFIITLTLSIPIVAGLKKIESNPAKFLNKTSIKNYQNNTKNLSESNAYSLATQLFKLGIGYAVIAPKAILTSLGIPFIIENFMKKDKKENKNNQQENLTFKGKNNETLPKTLAKILNNKTLQDFATKHQNSNFPLHIFALKDILATGAFIHEANKNKKIKDEQKSFLTINSIISTGLSLISGYTIDSLTEKQSQNIINKIKQQNTNDPNLAKYLEGFKIIKPILILAVVYYTIIPFLSTLWTEKIKNLTSKNES